MKIKFLIARGINAHVANDVVDDFFLDIPKADYIELVNNKSLLSSILSLFMNNILIAMFLGAIFKVVPVKKKSDKIFSVLMNQDDRNILPYFLYKQGDKYLYLFDAWPKNYTKILRIVSNYNIKKAFLSSSYSCKKLNELQGKCKFIWVPEGVNVNRYSALDMEVKDIDVICIGRKDDKFHNKIADGLFLEKISYIYQSGNEIIFPNRPDFIEALSKSKISICVPASLTHPEKTGGVETITNRYFQSMASKCIILGHAPKELVDIFGYNPVIEIDYKDPLNQIKSILNNLSGYNQLVEKNFKEVEANHKWSNRWSRIKYEINDIS